VVLFHSGFLATGKNERIETGEKTSNPEEIVLLKF